MTRSSHVLAIGLTATMLALSCAASPSSAASRHRHHGTVRAHPSADSQQDPGDAGYGVADAVRNGGQGRGLYAGAGGIFDPAYQVPDPGTIQIGAQLLGGDFGKAYQDYYNHYYFYKYAYCPIGTSYVIYSRSCVGLGNLF